MFLSRRIKDQAIESEIEIKFPDFRSMERWKCDSFYYDDIQDFYCSRELPNGIHTIYEGGLPIDLHLDIKKNSPLVVCLNGALSSRDENLKLPVFSGFGVLPSERISILRISDPILYKSKDIKLGWYAGASGMFLYFKLCGIVKKIITACHPSKLIFFGGSGGGFASLNISRAFAGSIALVWNPQTDILNFAKEPVVEYASNAFGISNFDACKKILPALICTNLQAHYQKNQTKNHVLYMQNRKDWHVRWHCKPFMAATGRPITGDIESKSFGDDFYLYAADWGDGHAPPKKEFQKNLVSSIIDSELDAKSLFSEDSITKILST